MDNALAAMLGMKKKTLRTADLDGSPDYTWPVPVTVAAGIANIEIASQFPAARNYQPLDYVEISNDDVVNLTLILNGTSFVPVPSGGIRIKYFKGLRQIGVRNDDAATSTTLNLVYVVLRKLPLDADEAARRTLL